jgi:hypothetical protein
MEDGYDLLKHPIPVWLHDQYVLWPQLYHTLPMDTSISISTWNNVYWEYVKQHVECQQFYHNASVAKCPTHDSHTQMEDPFIYSKPAKEILTSFKPIFTHS